MSFRSFEDIEAWQNARALAKEIYVVSRLSAFERDFALKDQIRKSAVSILSNIAEGFERDGNAEFIQFLSIAKGSCGELRAQLYIALDCAYIDDASFVRLSDDARRVSRLVNGLIRYLKNSPIRGRKFR
ncbi:MAG: four helix bundle protein [Rhodothermales bacterium]